MRNPKESMENPVRVLREAGGQLVGRTRFQKVIYLLQIAGWDMGYHYEYRYYGPYSEELTEDIRNAWAFDLLEEEERQTDWGGTYSIFSLSSESVEPAESEEARAAFVRKLATADAVALELAATAAFLERESASVDPWEETKRRKPEKEDRIENAKVLYRELQTLGSPRKLPNIA